MPLKSDHSYEQDESAIKSTSSHSSEQDPLATPRQYEDNHNGMKLRSGRISKRINYTEKDPNEQDSDEKWITPSHFMSTSITPDQKKEGYQKEKNNWINLNAMEVVNMSEAPRNANIIGSHVR